MISLEDLKTKIAAGDDVTGVDTSDITDMSDLFNSNYTFNQDISGWDVSNVTNMRQMFYFNDTFNQPIGSWDVSSVTDMSGMFSDAAFNQPIDSWDVSSVTDMSQMFFSDVIDNAFNQPIGSWDVSSVTNMSYMFYSDRQGDVFNQDISSWDVSSVTNMSWMFAYTTAFDQDIGSWDVSSVQYMSNMFYSATLSTLNYDSLLIGWNKLSTLQIGVYFSAGLTQYGSPEAKSARDNIVSTYGWNISDGSSVNDTSFPTLSSSSPSDGATGVSATANIVLTFSEAVAVAIGNITIRKTSDDSHVETIDVTGSKVTGTGTTEITINPATTLDSSTGYYLNISATAFDDISGNSYAGITNSTTINFTTANANAPTLSSSIPADGAIDVAPNNTNIVLTFSKTVYVGSGNIVIKKTSDNSIVHTIDVTGSKVTGTGTTEITINTYSLSPFGSYYLNIDATAFDDGLGNFYSGITNATTLNFTTSDNTTTPPAVEFNPVDSATGIAATSNITLTFSKVIRNVDNSEVTNSNVGSLITLRNRNSSGSEISFVATIDAALKVITITPTSDFSSEQDVYVAIGATVEDSWDNAISANSAVFTIADSTAPTLRSSTPADRATGIAVDANIVLRFHEAVDVEYGNIVIRKTSNGSLVEIIDVTGSRVTGTGTKTITINPSTTLDSATGYYLTIDSTAFDDSSGNSYSGITLNFTTFDPTAIEGRVTDLEAIDHTHFDPTTIQGRVTALEEINQEQFDDSNNALSLGEGADTGGNTKAVSIGYNSSVTGNAATAIGNLATASLGGIALGNNANAGNLAVAIGNKATAAGSCLAFGDKTDSGEDGVSAKCVAIGASAKAKKSYEIRLGGEIADYDDDGNITKLYGRGFPTVHPNRAGEESLDNDLVSKKWVDKKIEGLMRFRGEWNDIWTYYKGEVVYYIESDNSKSIFLCTADNLNTLLPVENTNHWIQL